MKEISIARNVNIEKANDKYITFENAWDFICINFIEKLYLNLKLENVDIAISAKTM